MTSKSDYQRLSDYLYKLTMVGIQDPKPRVKYDSVSLAKLCDVITFTGIENPSSPRGSAHYIFYSVVGRPGGTRIKESLLHGLSAIFDRWETISSQRDDNVSRYLLEQAFELTKYWHGNKQILSALLQLKDRAPAIAAPNADSFSSETPLLRAIAYNQTDSSLRDFWFQTFNSHQNTFLDCLVGILLLNSDDQESEIDFHALGELLNAYIENYADMYAPETTRILQIAIGIIEEHLEDQDRTTNQLKEFVQHYGWPRWLTVQLPSLRQAIEPNDPAPKLLFPYNMMAEQYGICMVKEQIEWTIIQSTENFELFLTVIEKIEDLRIHALAEGMNSYAVINAMHAGCIDSVAKIIPNYTGAFIADQTEDWKSSFAH